MALINGAVGGGLTVPPTAASGSFLPLTGGTMSGPIVMGANKITGLANGTNPTDAVAYSQISGLVTGVSTVFGRSGAVTATSGDYTVGQVTGAAPLASPTFTGTVTLPDGTTASSSGITAGAAIAMGAHKITGLANGSASSDAAAFGQITAANAGAVALSVVTTAGDLIVGSGSSTVGRLAAGASGTVLTGQGAGVAPAYTVLPGSILATHVYAPAVRDVINLSTTLAAIDTTNATLAFTVPANGIVDVEIECLIAVGQSTNVSAVTLALFNHTGGAQIGNSKVPLSLSGSLGESAVAVAHVTFHLTGLSAGALQVDLAAGVNNASGSTGVIVIQGATGLYGASVSSDLVMKAIASV